MCSMTHVHVYQIPVCVFMSVPSHVCARIQAFKMPLRLYASMNVRLIAWMHALPGTSKLVV